MMVADHMVKVVVAVVIIQGSYDNDGAGGIGQNGAAPANR